ncbi:MAG: hypothetical protein VXY09_03035 [Bacteroidota bacterium]|nr:hypothetical protein [Bacteroidota bacterium]
MSKFWMLFGYISAAALIGLGIYRLAFYNELLPQIFLGIIIFLLVIRIKNSQ